MRKWVKGLWVLVLGFLLVSPVWANDDPAALQAQIEALKKQMAEMQAEMQAKIEALQKKLEQVQSKGVAPQVVTNQGNPVFSGPNTEWMLYGKIKVDFNYDTAQFVRYNDFVGAVANPASHTDYKNDSTNFNPRDTRFGFWAAHKEGDWLVKGRFEIDFYGTNSGNNLIPRMRLAYVNLTNVSTKTSVLIGQDWIPVARLNPSTLDFGILTAAGNLWWRVPQITVRQKVGNNLEFLVSAMKHRRLDPAREDRMPWLLARVAYTGSLSGADYMFALGGGYRHASYGENDSYDIDRYLVVGEWKISLLDKRLTFKGEAWWGQGIGECFLRYELDGYEDNDVFHVAEATGMWADLTYKFAPRWSATIGFGIDNPVDGDMPAKASMSDRQFTQNTQYFANIWYNITKPLKVGLEFIHIETERFDTTQTGNRYSLSMQYLF